MSILIFSISSSSLAQNYTSLLNEVQAEFNAGRLYQIPAQLQPVLENGSREEKIVAYRLLSMSYLLTEQPFAADQSYIELLRLDPEEKPDSASFVEMQLLAEKFTVSPVFTMRPVIAGGNLSTAEVINSYNVGNDNNSEVSYKMQGGFTVGAGMEMNFTSHIALGAELMVSLRRFSYQNNPFEFDVQQVDESHFFTDIPLYLKYTFGERLTSKRIQRPFVYAGHAFQWKFRSTLDATLLNQAPVPGSTDDLISAPVEGPDLEGNKLRKAINRSAFIGAGVKYKVGFNFITIDVRANLGLTNMLKVNEQYNGADEAINELLFRYGYVSDDFYLNSLEVRFAYEIPLYKARKKTTGKGIMKKILWNQE